jgi:ketosteroid isomerase-like protein
MTSEIRAAMQATNSLFNSEVFGKGNMDAFDNIYTREARILPPGAPMISGGAAIKSFWADFIKATNAKAATLETVEAMVDGDGVVEIGKAMVTMQAPGADATQLEVKYVVYWREEGGRWKWHVDIWNLNA